MCKRLNPSIEVPEVKDLVQHLELMLHSDTTVRTILFKNNLIADVSKLLLRLTRGGRINSIPGFYAHLINCCYSNII